MRELPARYALQHSQGLTPEGQRIKEEAHTERRCPNCGESVPARRTFCEGDWPDSCGDLFNETFRRYWPDVKRAVARRANGKCERCGWTPYDGTKHPNNRPNWVRPLLGGKDFEFDHIAEIAAGGDPLAVANLQMLCRPCHKAKTRAYNSRPRHVASPGGVIIKRAAGPIEAFTTEGSV